MGCSSHHNSRCDGTVIPPHIVNRVGRWKQDARERLVVAAVDLFTEQGYDDTTVAQIASRAGLTKSTFFRHFSDKRELLAAGQETLGRLLGEGIDAAVPDATTMQAVSCGLERASSMMGQVNRDLGPRIEAAVAASTELQERDALKCVGLAAAVTAALLRRGVPDTEAHVAGELGILALKRGYARWAQADLDDGSELAPHAQSALAELVAATRGLR